MKLDKYVMKRMQERMNREGWNPFDRAANIEAWNGEVAFDLWWASKVVARAQAMKRRGFAEVLSKDGRYEWKKV
jgi:hypothetical protein